MNTQIYISSITPSFFISIQIVFPYLLPLQVGKEDGRKGEGWIEGRKEGRKLGRKEGRKEERFVK
jgi:hypothetical protein